MIDIFSCIPFDLPHLIFKVELAINSGNKLEGDVGDIGSLQAKMSPYLQLREKCKCTEHIDKSETQLKISP